MTEDRDNEIAAIKLLDSYLREIGEFPKESGINKDKLAAMYMESRDIVRQNSDDLNLFRTAESLWSTCIRVVRCSGIIGAQGQELLINGKTYSPEAKNLYEHALALYAEFKLLKKC
jgi:hypothetical protein